MGIFSELKKAFDTGGVKVAIDVPKSFDWKAGGIPVTVILTGADEPRTVSALEFELTDDPDNTPNRTYGIDDSFHMTWTHPVTIGLAPGQLVSIPITVPVTPQDNPGAFGADAVFTALRGGTLNFGAAWYSLKVGAAVEGYKARRVASKRLKASGQVRITGETG